MRLNTDMVYTDQWADAANGGVPRAPIMIKYVGNTPPADDLATAVPTRGLINYPTHIQPIWDRVRGTGGVDTCTSCHTDPAKLDLRGTISGAGRLTSYQELLIGDPVIDPATNLPKFQIRDGVPEVGRGAALVETMAGNATGMARSSRLGEIMFGETLKAGAEATTTHPTPVAATSPYVPDHSRLLNLAEKRLIAEWMDLGGQYYNNPFDAAGVRTQNTLSETVFVRDVQPILRSTCATSCHQATGADKASSFNRNRFVLTGSAEGDFGVTLSMISNACLPDSNYLLSKPSTVPHPTAGTAARLQVGTTNYNKIRDWIASGCTS